MNERIKELAEQAKAESSQWLGSKPAITMTHDELEKFAKLIVRECAKFCDDKNSKLLGTMMKEHFGVEE